jgi:hypothetical protein
MSALTIPLRTDLTHYSFQVELEGSAYGFELRWNERDFGWYMSLFDVEGNPLITARRVVLDLPMLIRQKLAGLPPGQLIAIDTAGTGVEPGLNDLGGRVQLVYYDSAEFP